jgi:hypothetical protein
MTEETVRALAQQNPVRAMTARLGELKETADREILNLTSTLKAIDATRELLNGQGIAMTVDLGEIGNAAAHARRAVDADKGVAVFAMPARDVA